MTAFIIMGVSGCGKSTVGKAVAEALSLRFIEGDEFHPAANIDKMNTGRPLSDDDRAPWVDALIDEVKRVNRAQEGDHVIVACSALSKFVRKRLRNGLNGDSQFIHLHGDRQTLKRRLTARKGHFFDPDLLPSQFAALSMPRRALTLDIARPVDQISADIIAYIKTQP